MKIIIDNNKFNSKYCDYNVFTHNMPIYDENIVEYQYKIVDLKIKGKEIVEKLQYSLLKNEVEIEVNSIKDKYYLMPEHLEKFYDYIKEGDYDKEIFLRFYQI